MEINGARAVVIGDPEKTSKAADSDSSTLGDALTDPGHDSVEIDVDTIA